MSDGLKFLSAAIAAGAAQVITATDHSLFVGNEAEVFDFIKQHVRAYRELPHPNTVQTETGQRLPTANEPLAYYEDLLYQRQEYTALRDHFGSLREALSAVDLEAARASVQQMGRVVQRTRRTGQEVLNISEAGRLVIDRLAQARGYGGISGIVSGWPSFDDITGGYQGSDIVSWVGRPSTGKTYLLLYQLAKAHADGENILFVTTEMGQEQIARRWASISMGINPTVLKRGMISTHMERRLRAFYLDMLGAERMKIFSVGMNSKVSAIEAYIQEFGPSLVVIDGVYLLKPSDYSKNMSKVDRVSGVYDELKGLNLQTNIPFLLSTQLNRTAGKGGKDASLENLSFADAIGTHSSIVVAAKPGPTANPMDSRSLDFLKGREGESGTVAINFKFAPLNMSEIPPEDAAALADGTATEGQGGANLDWMA